MFARWDNLRVDIKCLDPRPPQMTPPNIYPEGIPFFDSRVPQDRPDRLEDATALQSVTGGFIVTPPGQDFPNFQNQEPGAKSPQPFVESIPSFPNNPEPGQPAGIGTPIGPNILADDVTFITGPIVAPDNDDLT